MNTQHGRAELLAAPDREGWEGPTTYKSIYLVPSKKKHDSGWHLIRIVGVKADGALEGAAWCDDICWKHEQPPRADDYTMRIDMTYPGGIVHCWDWHRKFIVGASLSSTDITVRNTK